MVKEREKEITDDEAEDEEEEDKDKKDEGAKVSIHYRGYCKSLQCIILYLLRLCMVV